MNACCSGERLDALQEIANIGMGQAGEAIARVFDEFIELSVPSVKVVTREAIGGELAAVVGEESVATVRQAFHGDMRGEMLVVFDRRGGCGLAELMGHGETLDEEQTVELLVDVGNVIAGACLRGIAGQVGMHVGFSAPEALAEREPRRLFAIPEAPSSYAMFVAVNFRVERRNFACHLIVLMPESELAVICAAIDAFLEQV